MKIHQLIVDNLVLLLMDLNHVFEHFLQLQILRDFKSSASVITTGTLCKPAFCAASHLLSPAIISNLDLSSLDFLTIIG